MSHCVFFSTPCFDRHMKIIEFVCVRAHEQVCNFFFDIIFVAKNKICGMTDPV